MSVPLQRWTGRDGQEWVCGASDHSPFCRLCQPVDDVLRACLENIDDGYMEVVSIDPDGDLRMRLTSSGERRVEELMGGRG